MPDYYFNGVKIAEHCTKSNLFNAGTKKKPDWRQLSHNRYCECGGKEAILTKEGQELLDFIKHFGSFADVDHGHSF